MKRILKSLLCAIALILGTFAVIAQGTTVQNGQGIQVERWIKTQFGKGKTPPFSFIYGGRPSSEVLRQCQYSLTRMTSTEENQICYLATYTDNKTGLKVECEIKGWTDYGAVEWVLRFENTGSKITPAISQVQTADITFVHPTHVPKVYYAEGSNAERTDFAPREKMLKVGDTMNMEPRGGRSSDSAFPFFNIQTASNEGVMVAVGWTGTWQSQIISTSSQRLWLKAGLKHLDAGLLPGERIRTASICLLFWQGSDRMVGHNLFRRYMLAHHTRKIDNKPVTYPIFGGFDWGDPEPCNEYTCLTTEYAIAMVQRTTMFGLDPEAYWLDAGWYTDASDYASGKNWYNTAGNWTTDPERFPDGFKTLSDYIHKKANAKLMVWFEPERVYKGTKWEREHPEWMLSAGGNNSLLNIGNPDACRWLCKTIGDFMEKNGIDYYRQDFNIAPERIWLANDTEGRKGITEVKHIMGLYDFWDYLLNRFPRVLIDNCASGGRRIDYETMLRSAPMWRTDYNYGEPVGYQCHTYGLEFYLSQHATGSYHVDPFDSRSSLGSAGGFNWPLTIPGESFPDMLLTLQEFRDVRPYYNEDFYPLSGIGDLTGDDIWLAYQLHRPSDNTGYIIAFRRAESKDQTYNVRLSGLIPTATYSVYNKDNGETKEYTGQQLANGLTLTLDKPRTSLLLKYEKK
ncbi:MAG: alpha-galactosidase [Bacteroidales bacterium]|nr:alpha-galactosidase [Bacteroidales bacterium]